MSRISLIVACSLVVAAGAGLLAQPATATLFVLVEDSTGGRLPGAALSLVSRATGVERFATTNGQGSAALPLVGAGDYRLVVRLSGFRTSSLESFHLEAGAVRTVRITLEPGSLTETVQVAAGA